ncbi:ATP-dependent zinc metalloprotease FtsH [Sphingomonas sp. MMS24-J13]|uniref:ATP-dependent zinc metalloprotease FtsH n=1 Tax=Sphingomonas sp. MMS24-J13 TaxID=3238686 RepID=UPI00384FB0A9
MKPGQKPPPRKQTRPWHWATAAFFGLLLAQLLFSSQSGQTIPYNEFLQHLRDGRVAEVVLTDTSIQGKYTAPDAAGRSTFVTARIDPAFAAELDRYHVRFSASPGSGWLGALLSWIAPILLWVGIWWFMMRGSAQQGAGGLLAIGKSRVKLYVESDTGVTFDDVAGVDEAKEELREVVAFLKDPVSYGRLGAHMPKGVLLVGPPGTGKTLLAKAVAGEAGVPFFSISGSEFVEMFVGVGAARVRDLFEQARDHAPCIIFIDELDALGSARGLSMLGGHDEKEQTLDQLLAEMDGFDTRSGVVILAATNRPEILDPALLRAGRFDRHVLVDRPDRTGRAQILRVHLRAAKTAKDVDPDKIAGLTPGFTGADLANLVNEAALHATRRNADAVTMDDFTAGVERIVAGLEQHGRLMNPRERLTVARHEMGHALVALTLPGADPVHKVSIIPHGMGSLGYTMQRPTEDRFILSRGELADRLAVLLGGRAAELVCGGDLSTGAADDLAKATDMARAMVLRYGMSDKIGHVVYDDQTRPYLDRLNEPNIAQTREHSEATAALIDSEVRLILQVAFDKAKGILEQRRAVLEAGADLLVDRETLEEADLDRLVKHTEPEGIPAAVAAA